MHGQQNKQKIINQYPCVSSTRLLVWFRLILYFVCILTDLERILFFFSCVQYNTYFTWSWILILLTFLGKVFYGSTTPRRLRPPFYRDFTIIFRHTTLDRPPLDEWSARRTDLYLTAHNTQNRHPYLRRFWACNSSVRADADPRLRPRGNWDRQNEWFTLKKWVISGNTINIFSIFFTFEETMINKFWLEAEWLSWQYNNNNNNNNNNRVHRSF